MPLCQVVPFLTKINILMFPFSLKEPVLQTLECGRICNSASKSQVSHIIEKHRYSHSIFICILIQQQKYECIFWYVCEQTWNILHKAYETTVLWIIAFSLVWKSSQFFHHKMSRAILGGLKPAWPAASVSWHHGTVLHASWQGHCPGGLANLCVCTTTTRICWPDPSEAKMTLYPRQKAGKNKMGRR